MELASSSPTRWTRAECFTLLLRWSMATGRRPRAWRESATVSSWCSRTRTRQHRELESRFPGLRATSLSSGARRLLTTFRQWCPGLLSIKAGLRSGGNRRTARAPAAETALVTGSAVGDDLTTRDDP